MSAESEMAAILSHATNNASQLASSAQNMVSSAVSTIVDPVQIPPIPIKITARGLYDYGGLKYTQPGANAGNPGLPLFPDITLPSTPDIQNVSEVNVTFNKTLDALRFPAFQYPSPGNAPRFSVADPYLDSSVSLPAAPDTSIPSPPTLEPLPALPAVQMEVPPLDFLEFDVDFSFNENFFQQQLSKFSGSIENGTTGIRGLNELLTELAEMSEAAFGSMFTDFINLIGDRLTSRYQDGIASIESAIQQMLEVAIQSEATRTREALRDRSGWDRPALVQAALTATMEQSLQAWASQVRYQQTTDRWEHAQALFELSAELYERLRRTIQELKIKEIELTLDAHQQSILYARQVTDALLEAFTVENYQKYDLDFKKAEFQLRKFEEELKISLIQYELVFAKLEAAKSKQDQDGFLVQQYENEVQRIGIENNLLATQVATARSELELKSLPVEIFEAQIRAFAARVNAYEAQVQALVAEINSNDAKVSAESMKVKGFEAEADAYTAQVSAARTIIQSQEQRNDMVLKEFQAKVKAALAPIEIATSEIKYDLAAYEAEAGNFLESAKLSLEKMRLDDEWRLQEEKGAFDAYRLVREQALSIAEKRLGVLKAIADVHGDGAQIMAQMAGGAMSAANGIASVIFSEEL